LEQAKRETRLHSVTLDEDACKGCTNCIKRCPTEAIRVQNGKARIIESRCVDCGECIRHCPYRAKKALTDSLDIINRCPWPIALPAPSLYGQFEERYSLSDIQEALLSLGFKEVVDVALAANIAAQASREYLETHKNLRPLISSSCPAVLRLISVRFPSLLEHLVPVIAPMEIAAKMARLQALENGHSAKSLGVFFISPCAGKMTDLYDPLGIPQSSVNGVIAFKDLYLPLRNALSGQAKAKQEPSLTTASLTKPQNPGQTQNPSSPQEKGLAWGRVDGEGASIGIRNRISVDGIAHVINILEMAENGSLNAIDFIEAMACPAGCVGGPLTVENPFIARVRLLNREQTKNKYAGSSAPHPQNHELFWSKPLEARTGLNLADTLEEALKREAAMESLAEELPGLDCGSCGAPSCRALAEDIVCKTALVDDCIIRLREKIKELNLK